jgi:hypothetical protein
MAKTKISEFDINPANNTDINNINIAEGCAPSGINNAIRQLMSDLKDLQAGTSGDTIPIAAGGTGAATAANARTALGLAIGTDVQAYDAQLADVAGLTPTDNAVIIGNGTNFVVESGATLRTSLGLVIGTDVQAFNANNAVTNVAQTFTAGQRGTISALTDGATITPDFAVANNYSVTLGGNRTLANPSNLTAGQSGSIFITQDGTGSRTLAYGSQYDFIGGTAPTLSTAANAVDRIDYIVRTTGSIHCVFTANYS